LKSLFVYAYLKHQKRNITQKKAIDSLLSVAFFVDTEGVFFKKSFQKKKLLLIFVENNFDQN
jgi:hypothetical protein